jgi:hypothetical protein
VRCLRRDHRSLHGDVDWNKNDLWGIFGIFASKASNVEKFANLGIWNLWDMGNYIMVYGFV